MDNTINNKSVLSPRVTKYSRKKKKDKKDKKDKKKKNGVRIISDHSNDNKSNGKKRKKSRKNSKKDQSTKYQQPQQLQQMFMGDNNYWRQYFDEVLSPANRFPLPPQSPAIGIQSEMHQSDSQRNLLLSSTQQHSDRSNSSHNDSNDNISSTSHTSSHTSTTSRTSTISTSSIYCGQHDRDMAPPPERLPELDHNFYIYEFALLNDMDWNIKGKNGMDVIGRELKRQNVISSYYQTTKNSIYEDGEELIEPTPTSPNNNNDNNNNNNNNTNTNPIREYPSQNYDVSKLKRRKHSQDASLYSSFDWTNDGINDGINNELEEIRNGAESVLSETMELFTNSKDVTWLKQKSGYIDGDEHDGLDSDEIITTDDEEDDIKKRFDFVVDRMDNNNNDSNQNENDLSKLKQSQSLQKQRSRTKGGGGVNLNVNNNNNKRPKVKKYHTIGNLYLNDEFNDDNGYFEDGFLNQGRYKHSHSRTSTTRSMRLNGLQSSIGTNNNEYEHYEEFDFRLFSKDNQSLDIRRRDKPEKFEERVLSSDYLTFELEKECQALEAMLNKIRQENELLHEIPQLNLKDLNMLEMVLTQLSEYSLSYSNQELVLEIACDILKEITEIQQMGNKNESRAQCVEYQASIIDVGKTSCIQDTEIWQNTVWCNNDFISQTKFDFNVMKINRFHDDRPRDLYTDLKKQTLTIHDPTNKGKQKEDKVLNESLIKHFNYKEDPDNIDRDIISLTYWPKKINKDKSHFNARAQKFVAHRFVTLMRTYISPKQIPYWFKFGQGPFTVERMFPNRLIDFELPERFPQTFLLNLLQQKYVELSLMEKWCWSVTDSSSWMTDSNITSRKNLKSKRIQQLENLIKSFNLFLKFQGYELVSMLPIGSNKKNKRILPRTNINNNWLDSKLDQLSVPKILCSLVPGLAEYLHDVWLKDKTESSEIWKFCQHHSFYHKFTPWLVPWNKLPPSGKNIRTQQAVILIKGAVAAGMFFKPRDLRIRKNRR